MEVYSTDREIVPNIRSSAKTINTLWLPEIFGMLLVIN